MRAYQRGDLPAATQGFQAASQAFVRTGDELSAAEAANNLCVALLQGARPQEALACVQGTPAVFESHKDPLRAAQAYGNLGNALEDCGRLSEAGEAYRHSLELFRSQGGHEGEALILQRISQLQLRQGQPIEALAAMQASLSATPRGWPLRRWLAKLLTLPSRFFSG